MAGNILANCLSKSNFNSRQHLKLYQKALYIGSKMAALLSYYDENIGLTETAREYVDEWSDVMNKLAKLLI